MIKLDVNHGVYTMDLWICLDETSPVFDVKKPETENRKMLKEQG